MSVNYTSYFANYLGVQSQLKNIDMAEFDEVT